MVTISVTVPRTSDAIAFLGTRKERQISAKEHIGKVLDQYNVYGVDTLIGDIVPPESLMKTLTDRKLAEEQKITYETEKRAQETRQTLEKETAIAEIQKEIVKADQGVLIAERIADASVKKATGDANSVRLQANAEADRLKLLASGEAEKTRLLAKSIRMVRALWKRRKSHLLVMRKQKRSWRLVSQMRNPINCP